MSNRQLNEIIIQCKKEVESKVLNLHSLGLKHTDKCMLEIWEEAITLRYLWWTFVVKEIRNFLRNLTYRVFKHTKLKENALVIRNDATLRYYKCTFTRKLFSQKHINLFFVIINCFYTNLGRISLNAGIIKNSNVRIIT